MQNGFRLERWCLFFAIAVTIGLGVGYCLVSTAPLGDGLRLALRVTARSSLALFLMAFTASSLAILAPGSATAWVRRNRRYLGLAFAFSHLVHAGAILALWRLEPALFWQLTNVPTILSGASTYAVILAMAATSFSRSAALIGPVVWRQLHLFGSYYIWLSFVFTFGKRAAINAQYWPAMALIGLALLLRIAAAVKQRQPKQQAR